MNELPDPQDGEITHGIVTHNGNKHLISFGDYKKLQNANLEDTIKLYNGVEVKVNIIGEVMPLDEFKTAYPDKANNSGSQPTPRQFSHDRQIAVKQLIEDFTPICAKLNFTEVEKLVLNTWQALEGWQGGFEDFCIKHKALTPDGLVTTTAVRDDKGYETRQPFAYPFFCAIKQALEAVNEKIKWEDEHTIDFNQPATFDKIINEATPSGINQMLNGLDKFLTNNPNSGNAKRLQQKMTAKK